MDAAADYGPSLNSPLLTTWQTGYGRFPITAAHEAKKKPLNSLPAAARVAAASAAEVTAAAEAAAAPIAP